MRLEIEPPRLRGRVAAISSKSVMQRLLICALASEGETSIAHRGLSDDAAAVAGCLRALGRAVSEGEGLITVGAGRAAGRPVLDCGGSATAARLLLPVAAALTDGFVITGNPRLCARPMEELCAALEKNGLRLSSRRLPLEVEGRLEAGLFELPGNISSQYVSGLMLAAPLPEGDSVIRLTTPLSSAPYVALTEGVQRLFGVEAAVGAIRGGQRYVSPGYMECEGDWSAAAPWLCFDGVEVTGLNPLSLQGDSAAPAMIGRLREGGDLVMGVDATPDLLPTLAALAAFGRGTCRFTGAGRLRLKESDRLSAMADMIAAVGGSARAFGDCLEVEGRPLAGGAVSAGGDHRIAMAAVVLAAGSAAPVILDGAECVSKSYPDFWRDFASLGGVARVL